MNIFIDASVDSGVNSIGIIAITSDHLSDPIVHNVSPDIHESTYAELFTAHAALEILLKIPDRPSLVTLYSDCSNLCTLSKRRQKSEIRN